MASGMEISADAVAVILSILVMFIILFALGYMYLMRKRAKKRAEEFADVKVIKPKEKIVRHRPTPLKLEEVRYHRVPSQFTPLVITPTTPNQFTIPPTRAHQDDGKFDAMTLAPLPADSAKCQLSPTARIGRPPYTGSPKLLRAMSEGHSLVFKGARAPPHGKLECFLQYNGEKNCLIVQILGKKGHSLSWQTGISNPYIRVTLISSTDCEAFPRSSSFQVLNLPSNPRCELEGIMEKNLRDCLLKFVVLDFDRFSRSEFVAEVLVSLGDVGDLREGVTICEDLMLQQKVTQAPRGSLLISLCNQSVAQQLQVIIMKADGIPSKSPVLLVGSDLCVKTTLETSEACYRRKTKGLRKNNNYIFNEKLVFEVSSELLTDAILLFEVTRGDSKLRYETKVGGVKLGLCSSQALEMRHWSEMLASPQKQIAEWHQLRRF